MGINRGLFMSIRLDWETPANLFRLLDREFSFDLDVCASIENRKCIVYLSRQRNSLRCSWTGTCWMNPPYGMDIATWIKKARDESRHGATVVCLVPARTDTAWWHDDVMKSQEIRLLKGRLTFVGAPSPAPFPSAVVIFGRKRNDVSDAARCRLGLESLP